jgi:hypothetical protein
MEMVLKLFTVSATELLCSILVGKAERKGPFGRPRRRCEHDIRMDLRETVGAV